MRVATAVRAKVTHLGLAQASLARVGPRQAAEFDETGRLAVRRVAESEADFGGSVLERPDFERGYLGRVGVREQLID